MKGNKLTPSQKDRHREALVKHMEKAEEIITKLFTDDPSNGSSGVYSDIIQANGTLHIWNRYQTELVSRTKAREERSGDDS